MLFIFLNWIQILLQAMAGGKKAFMKVSSNGIQHVFICGSKSIGQYGGFETFVNKLSEYLQDDKTIKLHIACKANGNGCMDESKLDGVSNRTVNGKVAEFEYHNAHCFKLAVPSKIGPAQAIVYDVKALKYSIDYCKKNGIEHPIFYVLACRIGPFIGKYKRAIKKLGGELFVNPDGHEWKRAKWPGPVKKYWKLSEKLMVKHADRVVCDSINIEKYINDEYVKYFPNTVFIPYGADTKVSVLSDDDPCFVEWLERNQLQRNEYYLIVGRFVQENNYETIIREFMRSNTSRHLAIVTNTNDKLFNDLNRLLEFGKDSRIRFVGTVYDTELLKKIRENAYAYIHGHEVGGTNPSLLEALASTSLNMLLNVCFNKEVADDSAVFWEKDNGSLSKLIEKVDSFENTQIEQYKNKAVNRIESEYSWDSVANKYKLIFVAER